MIKPKKPANELQRQSVLESYRVLDTHAETAYDDLTRVASQICQTPIAVISLIDNERQWFKSKVGLEAPETPRDVSFCGHAIHGNDIMEVQDAHKDERFHDNPLVTGNPKIRFYAGAPLIMPTGEVLGTICVIDRNPRQLDTTQRIALSTLARNVVHQLQLRAQLIRIAEREHSLNRMIEQTIAESKARTQFFARISHDVRTPINGILGMMQALTATKLDFEQNECVSIAKDSSEFLLTLVNDILDFSTLETGNLKLETVEFDLAEALQKNVQLFSWIAKSKNLMLDYAGFKDKLLVKSDPTRLTQIISNLLGNATKFTEQGKITVGLNVLSRTNNSVTVEILVRDTGIGMSPDAASNLFNPFTQADDSIRRRFGGTGLGLSISKTLTEALGGDLSCRSELGKGTEFRIQMQLEVATQRLEAKAEHLTPVAKTNLGTQTRARILIAEDDVTNQKVFRALFKHLGCEITLVTNGLEAIDAIKTAEFDLVFMDRYMDKCDGLEATHLIRLYEADKLRKTPIIASSASTDPRDTNLFLEAGMNDVLAKPFRVSELTAILNKWIPNRKQESAA